jgi:hypothetical protein
MILNSYCKVTYGDLMETKRKYSIVSKVGR